MSGFGSAQVSKKRHLSGRRVDELNSDHACDKIPTVHMRTSQEWFRREPVAISTLVLLCAALFAVTYVFTDSFHREQARLGRRFFNAGLTALASGAPAAAVEDYQTALLYDPENRAYRFKLAQALAIVGRDNEARFHLVRLLESEPGDGELNLELARLAVRTHDFAWASRFFHGAIYGVWPENPGQHRREARLELVQFLLAEKAFGQAQAELVALSLDMPNDSRLQNEIGSMFYQAGDAVHALQQFRSVLKNVYDDRAALIGAGNAAFRLGQCGPAASYLARAAEQQSLDPGERDRLQLCHLVLRTDPFQGGISSNDRLSRAVAAFQAVGERLRECLSSKGVDVVETKAADSSGLGADYLVWRNLQPTVNARRLRRNPDQVEKIMNFVFQSELDAQRACGAPAGIDIALLFIAHNRSAE